MDNETVIESAQVHTKKPRTLAHLERELSALRAVATACTSEPDEDSLLERATDIICDVVGIQNLGVVLFDTSTGLLHDHPSARRGEHGESLFLRLGEGIIGTVASLGRPMRVPDVRLEPVYRMGNPATRSELTVPLMVGEQVLGVISCESPILHHFTEEDEQLLVVLAGLLASAMARLRSLRSAREQEWKYRAIFENNGHAMIFVEKDDTISICNKACEELAGCSRDQIEGRMKWMDFVATEADLARIQDYRNTRLTDPAGAPANYEYIFKPVVGDLKNVSVSVSVIPGTPKVLVVITDITERKRMETALVASERRYHSLFSNVPVGLYQATSDGRYIEANRTVMEMRGFKDLVFFMQHSARESYARPNEYEAWCRELRTQGVNHREMEWKRQDGSTFWVDERARVSRDATGQLIFDGSVIDITERKQAEVESELLRERLQQSEKFEAIGQLAGGVAHDFNNQLTIIMGFADALADLVGDDTLRQYAMNIAHSCQRSAELTKQLLAFARKGKLLSVPLDFHAIIAEVVGLISCSFDKRIIIRHRLEAEQSIVVGDPTQLQNALMNIAINARDAMPSGGELTFSTRLATTDDDAFLEVDIQDSGIGMDPETQRRVFEPFFTTKELGKGTGLGMASVYGTVKQHQGTIRVQSELGRGTCITLSLPVSGAMLETLPSPVSRIPWRGTGHVMIVDDENLIIEMLREILMPMNLQVTTFKDSIDALQFYREASATVDLVIMDIMLPQMGGEDLFLAMQVINPAVQVILVSGFSVEGEAQRMMEAGACGFLQKPFRKTDLIQELRRVLESEEGLPFD